MLVASFIITTIALVFGLLTFPIFITIPFCIAFAFIGLVLATINYIKKHDGENQILNVLPIVYGAAVTIALLLLFLAMYKTAVIDNIAFIFWY